MTLQQPSLENRIESLEAQSRGYWLLIVGFLNLVLALASFGTKAPDHSTSPTSR